MMIPKIINEAERQEFSDGSYVRQYVVYAPEWGVWERLGGDKVNHFVISESNRYDRLETLVFACDDQGIVESMIEVAGGRDLTADQVLTSFALIMMEAGYDTV